MATADLVQTLFLERRFREAKRQLGVTQFRQLFVLLFKTQSLIIYHVPGIILGSGGLGVENPPPVLALKEFIAYCGPRHQTWTE